MALTDNVFPVNFEGKKYDLKKFLRDHPGGVNTLGKFRGKSISQAMAQFKHSTSAYHMLNDFKIDELKDSNLSGEISENGRIITKSEAGRDVKEIAFLEELESRLDWSKPLLSQLHAVAPDYQRWVNSAVYRQCRIFASPLLESLTFTPWYLVPVFWIPIISYLISSEYLEHVVCEVEVPASCQDPLTNLQFLVELLLGMLVWTALEYSLHRWVFHYDPGTSLTLIKIHFLIHGLHHKVPFDGLRQVFPPIPAFGITCFLYMCLHSVFAYARIVLAGALIGYLTYDMIHFYVHHGSPEDNTYLYAMKRYHSNHHFINHDKAYGISCKLWDYVFGTIVNIRKLRFSLRW